MSVECRLDRATRLMLLAPHPDDDTLGAGILLRRAVVAGAAVRVVFATRGENNPWTQRVVERRLRIGPADGARFGERRRAEALAALDRLGVRSDQAVFLDLPDQGITDLLLRGDEGPVARLADEIAAWKPDLLILPSLADLHPDHSALSILVRLGLARIDPPHRPATVLSYVIHGVGARRDRSGDVCVTLTGEERELKREAIRCHRTQLTVHPRKFMSFAGPREVFALEGDAAGGARPSAAGAIARAEGLRLELRPRARAGSFGRPTISLLAVSPAGERSAYTIDVHRRAGRADVRRVADGAGVGTGTVSGRRGGFVLDLAPPVLPRYTRLFVKIERPFGFFDEAGWIELPAGPPAPSGPLHREAKSGGRSMVCCVIPCYNVASFCGDVVRGATLASDQVLAVDDGSSDGTGGLLRTIAASSAGHVRVMTFSANRGKGVALIEGLRAALSDPRLALIVTLDGDGQHRPEDIPRLVAAWRAGADLVIGARGLAGNTPLRSRIGNAMIRTILRRLYPRCPPDTQSGFRALDRAFAEQVVEHVAGARYETETHMLLLAMDQGRRITTVPIPTIYRDGNRSSHFRPIADSIRIGVSVLRWKVSQPGVARASDRAASSTTTTT